MNLRESTCACYGIIEKLNRVQCFNNKIIFFFVFLLFSLIFLFLKKYMKVFVDYFELDRHQMAYLITKARAQNMLQADIRNNSKCYIGKFLGMSFSLLILLEIKIKKERGKKSIEVRGFYRSLWTMTTLFFVCCVDIYIIYFARYKYIIQSMYRPLGHLHLASFPPKFLFRFLILILILLSKSFMLSSISSYIL